jgi:hypothetical protein
MNIPAIRAAIAKLGTGEYQDGSSAAPGTTYQPIGDWFPELSDIPCHKPEAVRDDFWAVVKDYMAAHNWGWREAIAIDMGAANGYYIEGLQRIGVDFLHAVERDPASLSVLHALYPHADVTIWDVPPVGTLTRFSVALVMNLHMWWTKQGIADERMNWCAKYADTTYFQTAGKHSGGMCVVPALDSVGAECTYLQQFFESVTLVRTTTLHGGERHLWRCTS